MNTRLFFFFVFAVLVQSCDNATPPAVVLQPAPNSRVVVMGNTFAERLQHYNYLEVFLHQSFPGHQLSIRNVGWSADEINHQSRPLNYPDMDSLLRREKADIIIAAYGLNESYKGADSVDAFSQQLTAYLQHLQNQQYNGQSSPQIILLSPIAHEQQTGLMPKAEGYNKNIKLYTEAMARVAKTLNIGFVDLYNPTLSAYKNNTLTINGIHLNDAGYQLVSEYIAKQLSLPVSSWVNDVQQHHLKKLIDQKNQQYFYFYRAANSEYIVGRRKEPWVQPPGGPISYPEELQKLQNMVVRLDSIVWQQSQKHDLVHFEKSKQIINDTIQYTPLDKSKLKAPGIEQFVLPEGYEINLFASEVDFSISNPVKITFDAKGRLWVGNMTSYPHYLPGAQPNDKIVILEDTDGDGKADMEIVFADSLYVPTSFELGKGGVYVSQPPNIWFMQDEDGDGVADKREIILHGFGTEDVHHSIDTYAWGPDGALYFHSGTFLHSQIETPYGPVRDDYGTTWRFTPETQKLERYVSYPYANPWGQVFTRNGTHIISDVSTGMNYFAPPLTVATDYPVKLTGMKDFLTTDIKPKTCGTEIISSRQFPDEVQGNILFNTFIGFQGIRQHKLHEDGSGIMAHEIDPLLQSKDPNFRPVDLMFGPDGALYVVDWYNPIINHGERALRDPLRDHAHGRIWRITYKGKPTLPVTDLTILSTAGLLDQLKVYEDRARYRARTQIRQLEKSEVLSALKEWIGKLDENDKDYPQHLLEALWVYQQFNTPNEDLLQQLLAHSNPAIRTAAVRVLFYWRDGIKDAQQKIAAFAKDPSPKVRLQAVVSLSYFKNLSAVNAILEATALPMDDYLQYAVTAAARQLSPVWEKQFAQQPDYLANDPDKANWLLGSLSNEKDLQVPGFITDDPAWPKYGWQALTEQDYTTMKEAKAVQHFRANPSQKTEDKPVIDTHIPGRNVVHIKAVPAKMVFDKTAITLKAGEPVSLIFENTDGMPHNLIIVQPGALEKVGKAADAMAGDADGYEKSFVPAMPEVLFTTPLVAADKHYRLDFNAPSKPGEYPFVCTFPGHWQTMRGVITVVK